jgi:uncharacterized protein (DUF885 family)
MTRPNVETAGALAALIACVALAACGRAGDDAPGRQDGRAETRIDAAERLDMLAEAYFDEMMAFYPTWATALGDHRYDDRYPVDIGPDYRAALRAMLEIKRRAAGEIERGELDDERKVSLDLLIRELDVAIAGFAYPDYLMPVSHYISPPAYFVELGSGEGIHPFRTVRDYDNFLGRIDGFEAWMRQAIANMREGMERGIVQPRFVAQRMVGQMRQHVVEQPEDSVFFRPVADMPGDIPPEERDRLGAAYRTAIMEQIVPSFSAMADFVEKEYLPGARESVGYDDLPGGSEWYEFLVSQHTTTGLTPERIHEIGLSEVRRIVDEMDDVRRAVGFEGDLDQFLIHLKTDPKFFWQHGDEILADYRAVEATVATRLPDFFSVLPRAGFEIRAIPEFRAETASNASYQSPSLDGSRPGVFYLNVHRPARMRKWGMETLFLHEAIPGHHFQGTLAQENIGLPDFRRHGFVTAYTEGWGLYSEDLGRELGLFEDPYQWCGKLNDEMLRAMRLVVDTGIHRHGWSREEALEYMRSNSALTEGEIVSEVERYIVWPGQALAYKIGQLEFLSLRQEAEAALGDEFDIRAWHDYVLSLGEVPLEVLAAASREWVVGRRRG